MQCNYNSHPDNKFPWAFVNAEKLGPNWCLYGTLDRINKRAMEGHHLKFYLVHPLQ